MMLSSRQALLALPTLVLLAACSGHTERSAAANPTVTPAPPAYSGASTAAGARMTASEVQSVLAGHTVTGVAESGQPYYAYLGPNGQVRFVEGATRDSGTWRVLPDGRLCSQLNKINAGSETCYIIHRTASGMVYDRPDGTTGSFTVMPGNPQNL